MVPCQIPKILRSAILWNTCGATSSHISKFVALEWSKQFIVVGLLYRIVCITFWGVLKKINEWPLLQYNVSTTGLLLSVCCFLTILIDIYDSTYLLRKLVLLSLLKNFLENTSGLLCPYRLRYYSGSLIYDI